MSEPLAASIATEHGVGGGTDGGRLLHGGLRLVQVRGRDDEDGQGHHTPLITESRPSLQKPVHVVKIYSGEVSGIIYILMNAEENVQL